MSGPAAARPPVSFPLSCKKSESSMTAKRLEKPQPKRQPTPEQIDAFVKTGEGNDTAPLASVSTESQRSVPSKCLASPLICRHQPIAASRLPGRCRHSDEQRDSPVH